MATRMVAVKSRSRKSTSGGRPSPICKLAAGERSSASDTLTVGDQGSRRKSKGSRGSKDLAIPQQDVSSLEFSQPSQPQEHRSSLELMAVDLVASVAGLPIESQGVTPKLNSSSDLGASRSVRITAEASWSAGDALDPSRSAAAWRDILGSVESGEYRRTFAQDDLERDFIAFCQMTSPVLWSGREAELKLRELAEQAAGHVVLPGFDDQSAADMICGESLLEPMEDRIEIDKWVESQSMFAALCASRIMTVPEEVSVVRRMHFLKYLAWQILTATSVDAWDLVRAHGLLKAAQWHRDLMVQSNMRLVVSIVKRLSVPMAWHDELVSDGIVALLRAVDKFDPSRGYRFCTYATPVIRRECFQHIQSRNEDRSRFAQSQVLPILASTRAGIDSNSERAHWINWRSRLEGLMSKLTKREQLIIRSRYCLGAHRKVKTLQRLAAALKISKERVRQLEYSALSKLRAAAESDV